MTVFLHDWSSHDLFVLKVLACNRTQLTRCLSPVYYYKIQQHALVLDSRKLLVKISLYSPAEV